MSTPRQLLHAEIVRDQREMLLVITHKKSPVVETGQPYMKVPAKPTQSLFNAFSAFAVRCGSTSWEKTNRLLAQLDFKFISWFQVQHGCVSLADQQVAVALNFCDVAQFATTLANCSSTAGEISPL
jgi:hypothetical protein